MKSLFVSMLVVVSTAGVAQSEQTSGGEIGYSRGSLGYDALIAGDNNRAIAQILADDKVSRNDPARLINLGQAYARTGRISEAAQLFTSVIKSQNELDLIMADGSVMTSKDAAKQALAKLQSRMASR
jgi:lipopolysaccharide biosynthesis regulator YciM